MRPTTSTVGNHILIPTAKVPVCRSRYPGLDAAVALMLDRRASSALATHRVSCATISRALSGPDRVLIRRLAVILIVWASFLGGLLPNVACAFGACGGCCPPQTSQSQDATRNQLPGCPEDALCSASLTPAAAASVHIQYALPDSRALPRLPVLIAPTTTAAAEFHTRGLAPVAFLPVLASAESGSHTYLRTARLRL